MCSGREASLATRSMQITSNWQLSTLPAYRGAHSTFNYFGFFLLQNMRAPHVSDVGFFFLFFMIAEWTEEIQRIHRAGRQNGDFLRRFQFFAPPFFVSSNSSPFWSRKSLSLARRPDEKYCEKIEIRHSCFVILTRFCYIFLVFGDLFRFGHWWRAYDFMGFW